MVLLWIGIPLALLGATMMLRGWIYTLRPNGALAMKRQKRNLKVGFTTDMKIFGRKVRRVGLMTLLVGATLIGWHRANVADDALPTNADSSAAPTTPDSQP